MQRYAREIVYRPRCRNAWRSWWLAEFAFVVCIITALLVRYGLVEPGNAANVLIGTLLLAGIAAIFAITAFVTIWRDDHRGVTVAVAGFLCASLILLAPLVLQGFLFLHPGSNGMSTDTVSLPPFSRSQAAFSARNQMIPASPTDMTLARQAEANPDIMPLIVDMDAVDASNYIEELVRKRGWKVVDAIRPEGRMGDGHVDAVAHDGLLRLPVDITFRIRPVAEGGARIDMRCSSRYPHMDLSDNAGLVRAFLDELSKGPPLG